MNTFESKLFEHLLSVAKEYDIKIYWCKPDDIVSFTIQHTNAYLHDFNHYNAMIDNFDTMAVVAQDGPHGCGACADIVHNGVYGVLRNATFFESLLLCFAHEIGHIIRKDDSIPYILGKMSKYELEVSAWEAAEVILNSFLDDPSFRERYYLHKWARLDSYKKNPKNLECSKHY